MNATLLKNLVAGAGSSSQFIGGLVVALLYVVIGLLGAIGSIVVVRRMFQGRWEQIFWTLFLFVIAARGIFPICYRNRLCHAWALGSIPLLVRLLTRGLVDDRNSVGLWHLLLNVRFYRRVLSHD
jgi:hypothetical protein